MAPGVISNAESIINNSLEEISAVHNSNLINALIAQKELSLEKTCPIDHSKPFIDEDIGIEKIQNGLKCKEGLNGIEIIGKPIDVNIEKTCPIDHVAFTEPIVNGQNGVKVENENGVEVIEKLIPKKPVRKVVKPKVLKNMESHDYLYDRLYDSGCPMAVSKTCQYKQINQIVKFKLHCSQRLHPTGT